MNLLSAVGPRHYLHRAGTVIAPVPDDDLRHAASPGGEQSCMPAEEAFLRERGLKVPRRIQHHLDDAFHIAIGRGQGADVDAQPLRDR